MTAFQTAIDIVNRALQRIGAERITAFTDDSKNASEANACYDRLRLAELSRNPWLFAIRRAALRPLDTTTQLLTFGTWSAIATYAAGDIVLGSDGLVYQSPAGTNLNHNPVSTVGYWAQYTGPDTADTYDATTGYYAGEFVVSAGTVYLSLLSANTDAPPSAQWLALTTPPAKQTISILYPIGSGPLSLDGTRNAYRLPYGYLTQAPRDPKAGSYTALGAPTNLSYTDWNYEGNYIVTREVTPILLRYVADIADVKQMPALFCEGLASRVAFELCEALTQSITKLGAIGKEYEEAIGTARERNAIQVGPVESELDDFLQCRL